MWKCLRTPALDDCYPLLHTASSALHFPSQRVGDGVVEAATKVVVLVLWVLAICVICLWLSFYFCTCASVFLQDALGPFQKKGGIKKYCGWMDGCPHHPVAYGNTPMNGLALQLVHITYLLWFHIMSPPSVPSPSLRRVETILWGRATFTVEEWLISAL